MDIYILKGHLYNMEISDSIVKQLDQQQYHDILRACAMLGEMRACVYVYDHMQNVSKFKATKETIEILEMVHSKTQRCNDTLLMHPCDTSKLSPRRRIHKIVKGANYSESYNKACDVHLDSVKAFLNMNPPLRGWEKTKLIRHIGQELKIPEKDVRYVITKLKRTKYFEK